MAKKYTLLYNFFFNYPTPSNLTYLWNFGVMSFMFYVCQLLTGFFLSMYYFPYDVTAFLSVENIMREVEYGWLVSYIHSNGASFFFFFVFMHIFSNLYFFSFLTPKYQVWNVGVLMFVLMMLAAFTGYVLPWGQMSFWAATVMTNLFSAVPVFGDFMIVWLWGSYSVGGSTLNSFFSFHFIVPLMMFVLMLAHFLFLHEVGSCNNLKMSKTNDKIMFHPYFTFKDVFVVLFVFVIFFFFVGFAPNHLSHPDNYMPADPMVTPAHMVPEWYFLMFYAMLRSVPSKLGGVMILFLSMLVLFVFPLFMKLFFNVDIWKNEKLELYDESLSNSGNIFVEYSESLWFWSKTAMHNSVHKMMFFFFFFTFVVLSVLGSKPVEFLYLVFGSMFTIFYFMYFVFNIYYFYFLGSSKYVNFHLNLFKGYMIFFKNTVLVKKTIFYFNVLSENGFYLNKYLINKK